MNSFLKQRLLSLILAMACAPILPAHAEPDHALNLNLPDIGDAAGGALPAEEERRLGEAFMRELRQKVNIVQDPEINEYIHSLGYRLASNSDNDTQDFTFFVVEDPTINAFAGPGGYIGVNTGLILATQSESELASVLAHEIAHVTQHHLARTFEKANQLTLAAAAALIAAIIAGSQNSQLGQAAIAAAQAGSAQAQINFTRGNEEEADRVGVQTLARADFDPRSMPAFFERLQHLTRFSGPRLPEFLSTHPVTESRIADARNRAEQYPYRQVEDSITYHLMRARLTLLSDKDPRQSVKRYAESLKSGQYRNEEAARYGYTLALLANGEYEGARTEVRTLLAKDKESLPYQIALAQIEMASGHGNAALKIYADALDLYPGNNPLTLLYARTLLQVGQAAKARDLVRAQSRNRSPDPELYKLLAEAAGEAGSKAEAHQALAEYYYLNGQTDAAIAQLNIALGLKDTDFYQTSQIEARLKQFQDDAREAKKH